MHEYDVAAIGELLIDFAAQGSNSQGYPQMQANPGGAPGNLLATVSKYGAKTAMIGKVGRDVFGQLLVDTLRKEGVDIHGVIMDDEVFTTLAFVTFDSNGERSFSFARKPGADSSIRAEELPYGIIDKARIFHFGSVSMTAEPARHATMAAVEYAKSHGKIISFDPNVRLNLWSTAHEAREAAIWGLQQADIVKLSDDEAEFLFGAQSGESAAKRILDEYGVKLCIITMGAKGAFMQNASGSVLHKGISANTIDTTGAGDIFGGSVLSRIIEKNTAPERLTRTELYEIIHFASTAAAISTERLGGISSIPTKDEVRQRL